MKRFLILCVLVGGCQRQQIPSSTDYQVELLELDRLERDGEAQLAELNSLRQTARAVHHPEDKQNDEDYRAAMKQATEVELAIKQKIGEQRGRVEKMRAARQAAK